MLNKILDVLFTVLSKSKHASIEKRVLRAILGKTLKKRFLQSKCKKYGIMDITSGSIVSRIKEDFVSLMNGSPIEKKAQTRCKINNEIVAQAVSFILQKEHIITTSWGDREFNLSQTEKIILPKLSRKLSSLVLLNKYTAINKKKNRLGRTSFYYIVKDITSSNRDIVTSVDYVQALLVTEPVQILQQVVDSLVHITERDTFAQYITATATFLKTRYQHHVLRTGDDCVTHDVKYVLGRNSTYDDSAKTSQKTKITCPQCMFPYNMCDELKKCITTHTESGSPNNSSIDEHKTNDAIKVIDECQKKFQLFMAHKAR